MRVKTCEAVSILFIRRDANAAIYDKNTVHSQLVTGRICVKRSLQKVSCNLIKLRVQQNAHGNMIHFLEIRLQ